MSEQDIFKQAFDSDDFYDAVRDGVERAMWRLMTHSTTMPCADFYESVKEGVEIATLKATRRP